jgi:hypothetical protein
LGAEAPGGKLVRQYSPKRGREPFSAPADQSQSNMWEEAAMQFADIFAYDLNTVVVAGPAVLLAAFAFAVAWMNHVPTRVRALDLAPAFGL